MTAQRQSSYPDHPKCKWHRRPESRPQEILEAAVVVFAELGFERATMADVARRAGVSPSLVVHYFKGKTDLFEAVINDRFVDFVTSEEALLASHRGPYRDLLHTLLGRFWAHMWQPDIIELMLVVKAERAAFPDAIRTVFQQLGERWRRLIEGTLEAGTRQGEFRIAGPHAARVIGAMLIGTVESTRCFGEVDPRPSSPDELWTAITALLDGGVLAAPLPGASIPGNAENGPGSSLDATPNVDSRTTSVTMPAAPGAFNA